jgi:preprotein translocase subunit SecG
MLAVQTMRNSIMASTVLASVAITLSSLVAVLMAKGTDLFASSSGEGKSNLVVGASGEAALTVMYFTILVCFLVAFLLNVQSIRYYSHTGPLAAHRRPARAADYVTGTLNHGFYFWSLGLRAYYFSCPIFLWLFGPVPMCSSCVAMVGALYFLDVSTEWDKDCDAGDDERKSAAASRVAPRNVV